EPNVQLHYWDAGDPDAPAARSIPTLMFIAEHWANVAEPWYNALCPETPTYVMGGHLMAAQFPERFNARLEEFLATGK
ncbi:MAG: hypothetical protein Q4D48_09775, partial [Coriobacteriales bacterium]|nr:hypothetical protein [Coriobacteriales bacterium]